MSVFTHVFSLCKYTQRLACTAKIAIIIKLKADSMITYYVADIPKSKDILSIERENQRLTHVTGV